ncbi:MAG: hypothetical protein ABI554_11875 [Flavobacterium sp.]
MDKKLKNFFVKAILVLLAIHLSYFLYGYIRFGGIGHIGIYTEFYRFKFYDDVSISHFFISGLFLIVFLILLVRKNDRKYHSFVQIFVIGSLMLLISFLNFSFFISYSFGMNAKLKAELSENNFNEDKTLLNVLNPFLYNYTSYSSDKLFNVLNILYPKPYPVIEVKDSTKVSDDYYSTETTYYSIDTLKLPTADLNKITNTSNALLDSLGLDKQMFYKKIITKKNIKDSTEIIFKGREVNPQYDDICIFLENSSLYRPVKDIPVNKQKYQSSVKRYKLIYKYDKDSLLTNFKKLDTLFKKYNIETQIIPAQLTKDVLYYKDHNNEPLNAIRNSFDRKSLAEKFATLDNLFYKPNYLHPSIIKIYLLVVFSVWLLLMLLYILFNYKIRRVKNS